MGGNPLDLTDSGTKSSTGRPGSPGRVIADTLVHRNTVLRLHES
jgi:hypothetical protein